MSALVHHQTYIAKRTKPLPCHNNFGPQSCLFPLTLPECIGHPPLLNCLSQRSVIVSQTHHSLMKVILCHNITYGTVEVSIRLQFAPDIECLNISLKRFERYGSWRTTSTATCEILKHFLYIVLAWLQTLCGGPRHWFHVIMIMERMRRIVHLIFLLCWSSYTSHKIFLLISCDGMSKSRTFDFRVMEILLWVFHIISNQNWESNKSFMFYGHFLFFLKIDMCF